MSDEERTVLAHRYLYYVLWTPVLSDREYDRLENALPADSAVRQTVGSDLASDYLDEVKDTAAELLAESRS